MNVRFKRLVSRLIDTPKMAKRFGKPTLSIDVGSGNLHWWVLSYRWRGIIYIEKEGHCSPGGVIEVPTRRTNIIYG